MPITEQEELELLELEKEKALSSRGTKKPSDVGIPMRDVVEQKISQREDRLTPSIQQLGQRQPFSINPIRNAMPALNVAGGLVQRAEAAVANPLMDIQRGTPEQAFQSFISGIKGEELGELGDIIRKTGAGEIPSAVIGVGALAGVTKAVAGLSKMVFSKLPRLMTPKWRTEQAASIKSGIEQAENALQAEYSKIYEPFKSKVIDPKAINKAITNIPKSLKKEILKDSYTLEDITRMRTEITKQVGDGSWIKAAQSKGIPLSKEKLIETASNLKKIILDNVDDVARTKLKAIDPVYKDVFSKGSIIKKNVWDFRSNTPKTSWVESSYKTKNAGNIELLRSLNKYSKDYSKALKNVEKFTTRQAVKSGAVKAGRLLPFAGAAYMGIKKLTQ